MERTGRHSDQNSDVVRYEEFLAEDFTAT